MRPLTAAALAATLPRVKLTVTVITLNEAAHIDAALARSPGPTRSSSSTRAARTEPSRSPAGTRRAWKWATGRLRRAEKPRGGARVARLDPVARRRRAGDAGAGGGDPPVLGDPTARGYRIPRVTSYLGRWIRGTDWYPDHQLRLYDRRAARWNERQRPRVVKVDGTPGRLRNDLQHYAYRDISHHLATIDRYTTLAAEQVHAEGRATSALGVSAHPPFRVPPKLRSSRRLQGRRRRLDRVGAQLVLRVPEDGEALGTARSQGLRVILRSRRTEAGRPHRGPRIRAQSRQARCSPSTSTRLAPGAAARTRCWSP